MRAVVKWDRDDGWSLKRQLWNSRNLWWEDLYSLGGLPCDYLFLRCWSSMKNAFQDKNSTMKSFKYHKSNVMSRYVFIPKKNFQKATMFWWVKKKISYSCHKYLRANCGPGPVLYLWDSEENNSKLLPLWCLYCSVTINRYVGWF